MSINERVYRIDQLLHERKETKTSWVKAIEA